jgi:apolipoprotein N-acyltransferase
MNLISITIFSLPFILFVKTKYNIKYWFFSFLLILFATNYLYGLNVLSQFKEKNIEKHDFVIKIISPNIDLKEFLKNENNDVIIKKLIKLSNPRADQKTIFIWPEGMFSSIYLNEIKKYYIARSANNGISAFIDPNGRILHKIEFNDANTIIASLPMHRSKTIFSKYGNKIFAIIIFLYIFLFFYFKKVEKNEKKKLSFHK